MSCIDLILTNSPRSFQCSCVVEKGLPYFHRMVVTIIKTAFQRSPPKVRTYRNHNKCYNQKFRETLVKKLSLTNTWNDDISKFINICTRTLDKHAPPKKEYIRGNHLLFIRNCPRQ